MTDLIASLADSIVALINAKPSSPTKAEIEEVLRRGLSGSTQETWQVCVRPLSIAEQMAMSKPGGVLVVPSVAAPDRAPHPYDESATVDACGNLYDETGRCVGWCGMTAGNAREIIKQRGCPRHGALHVWQMAPFVDGVPTYHAWRCACGAVKDA